MCRVVEQPGDILAQLAAVAIGRRAFVALAVPPHVERDGMKIPGQHVQHTPVVAALDHWGPRRWVYREVFDVRLAVAASGLIPAGGKTALSNHPLSEIAPHDRPRNDYEKDGRPQ